MCVHVFELKFFVFVVNLYSSQVDSYNNSFFKLETHPHSILIIDIEFFVRQSHFRFKTFYVAMETVFKKPKQIVHIKHRKNLRKK